ncbi:glycoside hydrolase family 95 protein [Umezawaea sp. Da 62-37]|uniref:glycoside hydrolase family 95 protein n=1 Tax=Umezawaea sp. Da 62-37 TaxID=3075927 RepID=UPI0028F70919|nr:glycoside hydrolase family 95 protein [Umezawaea sp. Da 62-37]WNV88597.1 glycoside hydrolase family 95 protein [Umezawaea sp. Da 62-37]
MSRDNAPEGGPTRRDFLRAGGALGAAAVLGGLPVFTAHSAVDRPPAAALVPHALATKFWYPAPAVEAKIIEEGLPIGNGRLGALVGGDPARDFLYLTDATLWTGGLNAELQSDGQFPYDYEHFGTFSLLAKVFVALPGHTGVTGYRRELDLSNGVVTTTYRHQGTTYRREVYSSHPDDVVVVRLTRTGGGTHTGSVSLAGTHGEPTTGDATRKTASFAAAFDNGLKYAAVVTAASRTGRISVNGNEVAFTGCAEVVIVVSGGTNYVPDAAVAFKDAGADPAATAWAKARDAARETGAALLATHVHDHRGLYDRMSVDLGASSAAQRSLDTRARLGARAAEGSAPDPELEASYLQYGRYLTITGSRDSLPLNLQGLWLSDNTPDWYSDYHTDINVQMNYWLADRAGLPSCFDAFADYCLSQVSSWTTQTKRLFNDPRNGFRNSSGKVAGWTVAYSTNIYGGSGWWWHPPGNAWLCNSLWEHYEFTKDLDYLRKIHPLLKGACEFWEARLIWTTVTDPATGAQRRVLVDDSDWSPEHGPTDAKGVTYAQEIVWDLFEHYRASCLLLGVDRGYWKAVGDLQVKLHLPEVSPKTGWLQEWMTPDNLGETTHRHLSPLIGLFPGDRVRADTVTPELLAGARNLLVARGFDSFGWACAWRALCWARLKEGENAYRLLITVLRPSVDFGNGSAANLFDMYSFGDRTIFQIDANLGAPSAMVEMLLYSRPGVVELLPALPSAWAESGRITGVGARGGFEVDFSWRAGKVTSVTVRSVGGTSTAVKAGTWSRTVTLGRGESVTLTP